MTQEDIKTWAELAYATISNSEKMLKWLRSQCEHPNTYEGNYSYRIGAVDRAIICSDCGEVVKLPWMIIE